MLVRREKLSKKDAKMIAEGLNCSGGGLYAMDEESWEQLFYFGREDLGDGEFSWNSMGRRISGMLARRRNEKGAVPESVRSLQGW